jgi:hypothetical protein
LIPTVVLVAFITAIFWMLTDYLAGRWSDQTSMVTSIMGEASAVAAAGAMYGLCAYIALNGRAERIEKSTWRQGSPSAYVWISIKAGALAWAVILVSTIIFQSSEIMPALAKVVNGATNHLNEQLSPETLAAARLLLGKIFAASPWFLLGSTLSVVVAMRMAGDVRRTMLPDRLRDAYITGIATGFAAAAATALQTAIYGILGSNVDFGSVPTTAFAGFACGWVVGFCVPQLAKSMIVRPPNLEQVKALKNLRRQAIAALGKDDDVDGWLFGPYTELGGVSPAEAIGYTGRVTGVRMLLEELSASLPARADTQPPERSVPVLISGGLDKRTGT